MTDTLSFSNFTQSEPIDPELQTGESEQAPSWADLVERIRCHDALALEELYAHFSKGIRFLLCRQLGPQDLDDKVHDVFLIITQAIQNGDLREPERLMGYVRTIVRRQVAAHIDTAVNTRRNYTSIEAGATLRDGDADPERKAIQRENMNVAMRVLNSIPKRDREVLIRFYLKEETPVQICDEMALTETQFRLIKSRAKARFGQLGRARLSQPRGFLRKLG